MKTKTNKRTWLKYGLFSVLAIALIGVSYFVSDYLIIAKNNIQLEKIINEQPVAKALAFTNEKGQKWYMSNPGKNVINIGGKIKEGPKIVKAEIDPLKVSVGQKQTMNLEVNSEKPLTKVVAEITTDHKTITVELKQTGERDVTLDDIKNSPFLVKDNGEVVFETEKSKVSQFVYNNLVNRFFEKAQASNVRHYTFSGDWVVHDTGETTYRTKFIAYDNNDKSNSTTLSWSDPCSMPISKNITWSVGSKQGNLFGYYENNDTEGDGIDFILDNGTGEDPVCDSSNLIGPEEVNYRLLPGKSLTITSDKLIITPGKKIKLSDTAYLNLPNSNTKIAKGYIWIKDNDGDGYFTSTPLKRFTSSNTAPTGQNGDGSIDLSIFNSLLSKTHLGIKNFLNNKSQAETIDCSSTGTLTWKKTSEITNTNNFLLGGSGVIDCDDSSLYAHPNSGDYCGTPRSNGSYDYNCDGVTEKETQVAVPGTSMALNSGLCSYDFGGDGGGTSCDQSYYGSIVNGFLTSETPNCGTSNTYRRYGVSTIPKCSNYRYDSIGCNNQKLTGSDEVKIQNCR